MPETTSYPDNNRGHGFGTLPVFLAGISTILGAIMFLRFGYAVGHTGLLGTIGIIIIGHLVTIPTALALAEIATNKKVEGGGEYFIISRSFGTTIGSVIGIPLYLSQAISVAFYIIALAEAFRFIAPFAESLIGMPFDPRMISVPVVLLLAALMLTKGAAIGVRVLYVVVAVLAVSLLLLFLGNPVEGFENETFKISDKIPGADPFFVVFAICFPAFTGMTAGVGLSGDLANPRKSIPAGTMLATLMGMLMYVAIVIKLAVSAPPQMLAENQFVMSEIALWKPIIPIGLACAAMSSAIGSILVAPRTLQAIGSDGSLPGKGINRWLARGVGEVNEPRNTTLVTTGIALLIVFLGNVDFVARLISMFFMVTYGALCAISFLEHLAARPGYRPSFRSRWYVSLFGAIICLLMMFQMDPPFALLSLLVLAGLYVLIVRTAGSNDLAAMFKGAMRQATRYMNLRLQKDNPSGSDWSPRVLMVGTRTFDRNAPLDLLEWISKRYGFGTYLHFIEGQLNEDSMHERREVEKRLMKWREERDGTVYMDTIVSPSMTSALAQSLQVSGVSGQKNNTALFEFSIHDSEEEVAQVTRQALFAASAGMNLLVLRHGDFHFGRCKSIHIWLTWNDDENANLMVLLSYILLGHPDWTDAEVQVFAALPYDQIAERSSAFKQMVDEGRIPISKKNIRFLPVHEKEAFIELVTRLSVDADLIVKGFDPEGLRSRGQQVFTEYLIKKDMLFVHAYREIEIE